MGALPNAGPNVEFSIEGADYYPWQEGLFSPAFNRGWKGADSGRPGWGVEVSRDWIANAAYRKSEAAEAAAPPEPIRDASFRASEGHVSWVRRFCPGVWQWMIGFKAGTCARRSGSR